MCWIIIIKQLTERALLCVINTHDPYQGHRDPLSYVNKHLCYRLHISRSLDREQYKQ